MSVAAVPVAVAPLCALVAQLVAAMAAVYRTALVAACPAVILHFATSVTPAVIAAVIIAAASATAVMPVPTLAVHVVI